METFRGERCGIDNCRSREYHIDNGLTYCRRGHLQEGLVEHEQEFDDLNPSASQTTRIRDTKKEELERRDLQKRSGPRGLKLFRLAYEHILKLQITTLIADQGFSADYEFLVQEIWALRVGIAKSQNLDLDLDSNAGINYENSDSALETENESENEDSQGSLPRLIEMYAMCYIAAFILRIPLPICKLYEWIVSDKLLYSRAHASIPVEMRRKFDRRFHSIFIVTRPLEPEMLYLCIADFCRILLKSIPKLKLPPLNWSPILVDFLIRLGLPLQIFTFIESISRMINLEFTFTAPRGLGTRAYMPNLPELQLVATIVFAVKYYHPFDEKRIYATNASDPSYLTIDWTEWQQAHRQRDIEMQDKGPAFAPGDEAKLNIEDVYGLSNKQIDSYLDWFTETWIQPDDEPKSKTKIIGTPKGILKMFPLDITPTRKLGLAEILQLESGLDSQVLRKVYMSLKQREVISEERGTAAAESHDRPVPRAGSKIAKYYTESDLQLHPLADVFYKRVAQIVGISVKTLLRAVLNIEERIDLNKIEDFAREYERVGQSGD